MSWEQLIPVALAAETQPETLAQTLARNPQIDPDLAWITDAWHTLPPYVKAAILALAKICR